MDTAALFTLSGHDAVAMVSVFFWILSRLTALGRFGRQEAVAPAPLGLWKHRGRGARALVQATTHGGGWQESSLQAFSGH
jgi:hypothetical protein